MEKLKMNGLQREQAENDTARNQHAFQHSVSDDKKYISPILLLMYMIT